MSIELLGRPFRAGGMTEHGAYGSFPILDGIQYHYAGADDPDSGHHAYQEILEFTSPPEGRPSVVIHYWSTSQGHIVFDFDTVENALAAYQLAWRDRPEIREATGFLARHTDPWFYQKLRPT